MIDNKIVDLVDELLNCNKKLLWERMPYILYKYNCFNLRTLRVGVYKNNTKVYRVIAEDFKYKVIK